MKNNRDALYEMREIFRVPALCRRGQWLNFVVSSAKTSEQTMKRDSKNDINQTSLDASHVKLKTNKLLFLEVKKVHVLLLGTQNISKSPS